MLVQLADKVCMRQSTLGGLGRREWRRRKQRKRMGRKTSAGPNRTSEERCSLSRELIFRGFSRREKSKCEKYAAHRVDAARKLLRKLRDRVSLRLSDHILITETIFDAKDRP